MPFIIGLLTPEEELELERRGWDLHESPIEVVDGLNIEPGERMRMVWVDVKMMDVMGGFQSPPRLVPPKYEPKDIAHMLQQLGTWPTYTEADEQAAIAELDKRSAADE